MKAMLAAFAATALIAVLASYGLNQAGFSSKEMTSDANVRLD